MSILILRIWLQLVKADYYNPFSQFIVKVSNPLVVPLRRVIPGFGTNLLKQVQLLIFMTDQACGCEADSGDPDYSCDCAMQGHCICSADCGTFEACFSIPTLPAIKPGAANRKTCHNG